MSSTTHSVTLAERLTLDVLTTLRRAGSTVVVTGPSSPFCHGANVLRYWAARGAQIRWYVTDEIAGYGPLPVGGMVVSDCLVSEQGSRPLLLSGPGRTAIRLCEPGTVPREVRTVQALSGARVGVVLMGGRRYSRFAGSVMTPGLTLSARRLAGADVCVARLSSGHIAGFSERLRPEVIQAVLADPAAARPYLNHQCDAYAQLLKRWRENLGSRASPLHELQRAKALLTAFFGELLLLHETYTEVLALCLRRLGMRPHALGDALPEILRWQSDEVGLLPATKDLLDTAGEVPVAPLDLPADLASTTNRLRRLCARLTEDGEVWCRHLAEVLVLKEWKFYLAKALHRHFGSSLHRFVAGRLPDATIQAMPVDRVIQQLGPL